MTIALRYAVRSDIGLTRANNQDSAYAGPHLLVVADGMGGHAGGDIASSVAIAHLAELDEETPTSDQGALALAAAVEGAHDELLERVEEDPELAGLGTTITCLLRSGDRLILGHIGDSRAYLLRDAVFEQVTADHTFVQYLVDVGKLEPEQAERHPQRSLLLRVLGDVELSSGLDISVRKAEPGDRWLLCSDGLSGVVSAATLERTLVEQEDPDQCADALIELALRGGGPDNITCVVADIVDLDGLAADQAPSTAAQVAGAAAIDRDRPTRGGGGAAAKAASLAAAAAGAGAERAGGRPAGRPGGRRGRRRGLEAELAGARRRAPLGGRLAATALILALMAAAAGALYWAYAWSQDQFYVGAADGKVAIYRGIPQAVFGLELSRLDERTSYDLEGDLTESYRRQVEGNATRNVTRQAAWQWVDQAVEQSSRDKSARSPASTSPSPTRGPSLTPSRTPSLSPSPSPTR
ncbi:MAG: protein phosphatase 2C domain-containing protein, partial [Bifidobacteriaceae bacterium]|nr:protein phosphatase 2C domain-containing protein [Bifidobacteriaceae bacterium]